MHRDKSIILYAVMLQPSGHMMVAVVLVAVMGGGWWGQFAGSRLLVVAVFAKYALSVGKEPSPHQGHGTLGTFEAGLVPLTLLKGDVLPLSKPCKQPQITYTIKH